MLDLLQADVAVTLRCLSRLRCGFVVSRYRRRIAGFSRCRSGAIVRHSGRHVRCRRPAQSFDRMSLRSLAGTRGIDRPLSRQHYPLLARPALLADHRNTTL